MLRKKKDSHGGDPIGNSPDVALEKGRREWFERVGSPTVEKSRYFVIAVLIAVLMIALVFALIRMMPLNRTVPFIVQVDKQSGMVTSRPVRAEEFKPGQPEQQYFIVQWVRHLLELDPYVTERNLSDAYQLTRGKAIDEFTDFINKTQPIKRVKTTTSLTRSVNVKSVSFVDAGSAMVRVSTEERQVGQDAIVKNYVLTVHFSMLPPETEAEIIKNPIGIFITHFAINEEFGSDSK
jgi:type IV secretory pathway component VirB8